MRMPVDGFPGYDVGSDGSVYGPRGKMRGQLSKGYYRVTLYRNRQPTRKLVASLVMEAFVGPKPAGHDIDHIDGNRLNNDISNLRYLSSKENRGRWSPERRARVVASVKEANTVYCDDLVLAAMWSVLRLGMGRGVVARSMGLGPSDLSVWCAGKRRPHLLAKVL
jgi:hypothetical protein